METYRYDKASLCRILVDLLTAQDFRDGDNAISYHNLTLMADCVVASVFTAWREYPKMEGKSKYRGLVQDLWPNIKMMQGAGLYLLEYHENDSPSLRTMRRVYSYTHLAFLLVGFASIIMYLFCESYDVDDYAANTVTVLFFLHSVTRTLWFMLNIKKFYRLFDAWNTTNSHPLFAENDAKHHAISLSRQRRLLIQVMTFTVITVLAWTVITFVAEPMKDIPDPENENMTVTIEVPQLMLGGWYPWDAKAGIGYIVSFVYQLYWLFLTLGQANLYDVLLCCFVIYACGQLRHLKEILRPLMELSASLDNSNQNSANGKKSGSGGFGSRQNLIAADMLDMDYRGLFKNEGLRNNQLIDVTNNEGINPGGDGILPPPGVVNTINVASRGDTGTNGVNGTTQLNSKQELLVRSAIKYWVERHKQLVRYVSYISLAFGGELLIHMLNATIVLTILAYQATKVSEFNVYACCTAGYIFYSMAQIYLFCIYGNEIIEESSTVMEAAYSCHWYDGSEEVKTFVQIVCQQCQKNLVVSGARFFTVSLDLFASVLGAMVTYFMVLIQLN